MDSLKNCKPADWETGFESKQSAESLMPYKEYTGLIEKSDNDQRQYRLIRLPNNLVALCVQDTEAKEAAASLSVNVGSNANPAEFQGLAHFLEHMLFLNALDRFAQFFISPLFNADCVDRELKAVDSEYKGTLQADNWRTFQLTARTSDPAHPYSGFSVGNTETLKGAAEKLGLNLREELIKFYQKYYSADIMRLTVVGNHSLDVLTEWVASKFSGIASKGNTKPTFEGHPIGKAQLGKLIHYKTVCEKYTLGLQFSLPELKSIYREKPLTYLSTLLDSTEEGSIFSVLRKNGWATAINGSPSNMYNEGFGIYEIDIDATPEGLDNYEAILSIVFGYLKMLAESGPQEWFYQELSLINKAKFDFKDKENAEDYDAGVISKCLQYLNPSNYRLFIGAKEHKSVECKLEEKYYGVPHNIAELPPHLTSNVKCSRSMSKQLHLPGHNAFLPDNLSVSKPDVLANPPAVEPVLLRKNDKIEIWFKQDDQFFTPHGHIGLTISSESIDNTALNHLLTSLLCELVSAELQEQLYSASIANSKFGIAQAIGSINID
ncbi:metalloprotease, partial [Coemansia sp. S85]